jgi:DNA-directed RNA polymerase specialized sigma24 family protein
MAAPLTEHQKELASMPEALALAKRIAGAHYRRSEQHDADAVYSAALWGLCCAAREWNGIDSFIGFAAYLVPMRMRDALRGETRRMRRDGKLVCRPQPAHFPDGDAAHLATPEEPVGWELESEDAVLVLTERLPPEQRARMRDHFLHAGCQSRAALAEGHGVSVHAVYCTVEHSTRQMRSGRFATVRRRKWTPEDDAQLLALRAAGRPFTSIAEAMGREATSVRDHYQLITNPAFRLRRRAILERHRAKSAVPA